MIMMLKRGDCIELMKEIPDGSVDMVFTDPPYKLVSGGCNSKSTMLKVGVENTPWSKSGECFRVKTPKFSEWVPELYRVLKDSSYCLIMTNDRNMRELWDECLKAGFIFCELLVMSKGAGVPSTYFYKSCEFILMFRKGSYKKLNRYGVKSVFDVKMPRGKDKIHPTEKPVPMIEKIVASLTASGETVLDPFMGSGSTGVACINIGRKFIGIEKDDAYFRIAAERIRKAGEIAYGGRMS